MYNQQPPVVTVLVVVALILVSTLMVFRLSESAKCFDAFGITKGCTVTK